VIKFRTISPRAFNAGALEGAIRKAQRDWMAKVLKEYRKTTKYWKHKVVFYGQMSEKGMVTKVEALTDDKIYGYVDEGTGQAAGHGGKYPITPKKPGGRLAFPSISTPKTKPGRLRSGYGRRGKVIVFAKKVMHPGIKPRDFSGQIKKKMEPVLEADLREAMGRGAKKSGHAI